MLRITVHEEPQSLTLELEGGLAGPWVQEAENCWQEAVVQQRKPLHLDLSGITFIDAAGKSFLTTAHHQGARLVASGCLMKAIVAEIMGAIDQVATPFR